MLEKGLKMMQCYNFLSLQRRGILSIFVESMSLTQLKNNLQIVSLGKSTTEIIIEKTKKFNSKYYTAKQNQILAMLFLSMVWKFLSLALLETLSYYLFSLRYHKEKD